MHAAKPTKRIVILGNGFGGIATARQLERRLHRRRDAEVVLVSRDCDRFMATLQTRDFSETPDACGRCESIRFFQRETRLVEAAVTRIDLERCVVRLADGEHREELGFDHLVLALGSEPNTEPIPGCEHAFTFRTRADAAALRDHVVTRFELADTETDIERRAHLLTFVVIGDGLVGVELVAELTAFVDTIAPRYKRVDRDDVWFLLFQSVDRQLPEPGPTLAACGARVLAGWRGVEVRTNSRVQALSPGRVHLAHQTIAADTIILAAGTALDPAVAALHAARGGHGQFVVEPMLSCPRRPEMWTLGNCDSNSHSRKHQNLSQHTLREARVARSIDASDGRVNCSGATTSE